MNYSNFRISLDIHETSSQTIIKMKKGDTGRRIMIALRENSNAYQIEEGCTAVFTAVKPDGNLIYNECTISENVIIYTITEQTANVLGNVNCEVKLYDKDGVLITSPSFIVYVLDPVFFWGDLPESAPEYTAFKEIAAQFAVSDEHINNLIDAKDEVFVAEYGITRFREIFDAYYANRACYTQYGEIGPRRFTCVYCMPEMCVFSGVLGDEIFVISVRPGEDSDEWDYVRYPIYTDEYIEEIIAAKTPTDGHINDLINEAVPVSEKLMLVRFNTQPGTPNCNKTYEEIIQALNYHRPVFAFRGNGSVGEMYIAVQVHGAIKFYPFYTGNGDGDRSVYSFIQITDANEVIMGEHIQPNTKNEVFIAEYGVTTRDEILAAYNDGKACFAKIGDGGNLYSLTTTANPGGCVFSGVTASRIVLLKLVPVSGGGNEWKSETYPLYTDEHIIELIQENAPEGITEEEVGDLIATNSIPASRISVEMGPGSTHMQVPTSKTVYDYVQNQSKTSVTYFALDIAMNGATEIHFTNMDQIKTVIDNGMTIVVRTYEYSSGRYYTMTHRYICNTNLMTLGNSSGIPYYTAHHDGGPSNYGGVNIFLDTNDLENDVLTPTTAYVNLYGVTALDVYAVSI